MIILNETLDPYQITSKAYLKASFSEKIAAIERVTV